MDSGGNPFVEIDHSGDVGIEASGRDLAELLEHVTEGLFALLCRGTVIASNPRAIRVEANTDEDVVVDWLNEVITLAGTYGEMYGLVKVNRAGGGVAEGFVSGETLDAQRHDPRFDVKAATYHNLVLTRGNGALRVRVIFDL